MLSVQSLKFLFNLLVADLSSGGLKTSLKFGGGSGHPMKKLLLVSLLNLFVFRGLFIFQTDEDYGLYTFSSVFSRVLL